MIETARELISSIPAAAKAVIVSMIIAALRIKFDESETTAARIALESALCGGLTYSVWAGVVASGGDPDLAVAIGGAIGYLGPATVRSMFVRAIESRFGKAKKKPTE